MTTLTYANDAVAAVRGPRSPTGRLRGLAARLRASLKVRRDLNSLRGASDHLLSDIGVTRWQLEHALATPFWVNPGDELLRRK